MARKKSSNTPQLQEKKFVAAPQPGPQLDALMAEWCTELLFGGARGGGKTYFLLMDFLKDVPALGRHWQGILFRKSYKELDQVIQESKGLYPQSGATWYEQAKEWRWVNGSCLRLRFLERSKDAQMYQGHSYCVAVGTPILMANGSSCPIERISVGDLVQTLQGPKRVTHRVLPYEAFCVEARGLGGKQVHPCWHRVLTDSGWQSYTSALGISSKEFEAGYLRGDKLPSLDLNARFFQLGPSREGHRRQTNDFSTQSHANDRLCGLSEGNILTLWRQFLRKFSSLLPSLSLFLRTLAYKFWPFFAGDMTSVPPGWGTGEDFQLNYSKYFHPHDAPLQFRLDSAPNDAPSPDGVGQHSRNGYRRGELGNTPKRISANALYVHPYTGQIQTPSQESFFAPLKMTPVGKRLVADISVAQANHYINANSGLISSNSWVGWDEVGNYPSNEAYLQIIACLRDGSVPIPNKRIRCTANPGGPGHFWLKSRFVDFAPRGYQPYDDPLTQMSRMYIPSRVTDNKILLKNDPGYINRLRAVGSEALVKAWLEGDWNAIQGAFFDTFDIAVHVIRPFDIPDYWPRWRSIDWGYAKPFSVGWYTLADNSVQDSGIPKGSIIKYREWYGCSAPNVGIRLNVDKFAQGILERSPKEEKLSYTVVDPSMFIQDGGPSIAETLFKHGIPCIRGDNKRVPGFTEFRRRLYWNEKQQPTLFFFPCCEHTIRTLPIQQTSEKNAEDMSDEGEDHAESETRYSLMSRVSATTKPDSQKPLLGIESLTMNALWKHKEEEVKRVERW